MTTRTTDRTVSTWNGEVTLTFRVAGSGPALVYLHPAAGPGWDPFLDLLAGHYTVYAPEFPGTTPGGPHAIHRIDTLWDAVLIYEQALRELGVEGAVLVGQSFGGMLAAELAELARLRSEKRTPAAASGSEIEARIRMICDTELGRPIGLNDNLFEIGASSLKLIAIHEAIDREYPGMIDLTELFDYPTIAELAVFLAGKLAAA